MAEFGEELTTKLSGFEQFLKGLADDIKDGRSEMRDLRTVVEGVTGRISALEKSSRATEAPGSSDADSVDA